MEKILSQRFKAPFQHERKPKLTKICLRFYDDDDDDDVVLLDFNRISIAYHPDY